MLSFRIKGGAAAAEKFCQVTNIFTLAESLGGVESLVEVPSSMTHAGIPKESREAVGVFDDLVRVSCGVEDAEDLKQDVLQALERAVVVSIHCPACLTSTDYNEVAKNQQWIEW